MDELIIPEPEKVKRIAVRLTNWVGDVVMNTPFLERLRRVYPGARITVIGRKSTTPLLEHHPHVDDVWTIDDRTVPGRVEYLSRLRLGRFDLGYLLPNSFQTAMLFRLGGVPRRVGYDRDGRGWLLTHPVPLRPDDLAVHEVRYYLRILDVVAPASRGAAGPLKLVVNEEEKSAIRQWLSGRGIRGDGQLLAVNPAAFYGTAKRWLPDRFARTARNLADSMGAQVVVTGLSTERDIADAVCEGGGAGFYNAAGEMSLRQLMAFLSISRLFITNDSGAMHVAAALGTPLVAVFGSTDWVTTAPLGEFSRIVRWETPCAPCLLRHCPIDHRCMTRISPAHVIEASEQLLAETGTRR